MIKTFISTLLIIILALPIKAMAQDLNVEVGGETFRLPTPENFVRVPRNSAIVPSKYKQPTGQAFRLLAIYFPKHFLRSVRAGNKPLSKEYSRISVPWRYVNKVASPEEFNQLREHIGSGNIQRRETYGLFEDYSQRNRYTISDSSDTNTKSARKQLKPLGIFVNEDTYFGFTYAYPVSGPDGTDIGYSGVTAAIILFLKGKLLYVVTTKTSDKVFTDVSDVIEKTESLARKIIDIN